METAPLYNSTSALFRLSKKLKALKPVLKSLGKEKVGEIIKKTREALQTLCAVQETTLADPNQINIQADDIPCF